MGQGHTTCWNSFTLQNSLVSAVLEAGWGCAELLELWGLHIPPFREYLAWARGRSLLSQDVTPAALRVTHSPWLLQSNLWVRKGYAVGNHEVAQICHKSSYVFLFTYNGLADTLSNGIPVLSKGWLMRSTLWTLDKWPPLWAAFVPSVVIPYQDWLWKSMWKCFIKKQKEGS